MNGTQISPTRANTGNARTLITSIAENVRELANSPLAKWAAIANILALLIAVLTLFVGMPPTPKQPPMKPVSQSFRITQPADGARVGPGIDVRGTARLDGKHHFYYLIVTPPQGSAQLQADAMDLSPDGTLHGRAVLGTGSVGVGKSFTIQILESTTAPRSLVQPPPDSVWSTPITVTREH